LGCFKKWNIHYWAFHQKQARHFWECRPFFSCDTEQFPQEKKYPPGITTQQNKEKEHVFTLRKARGLGLYPAQKQVQ
jgi:hypothetical protein